MDHVSVHVPATRLSADILANIFDVAHSPLDMIHLAQTCKTLFQLIQPSFKRHRDASETFRHASDRDPRILIELVRSLVLRRDPVVAKYVRSFDVWGARMSWSEWRRIDIDRKVSIKFAEEEAITDRFSPGEISGLLAAARYVVGDDELDAAKKELENGCDGILKLLVIASAPHLQSLMFIRRHDPRHKSCRAWLFKAIQHQLCAQAASELEAEGASKGSPPASVHQWPAGLASLQDLAVGVDSGSYFENDEGFETELWEVDAELPALMRLPRLSSLYYHIAFTPDEVGPLWSWDDWDWDDPDGDLEPYENLYRNRVLPDTPPRSSTVTQIYLDNYCGNCTGDERHYVNLLEMPWALESFAVRCQEGDHAESVDPSDFLFSLGSYQMTSLKKMMFYNPFYLKGQDCRAFLPEDIPWAPLTMYWLSTADVGRMATSYRKKADRKAIIETFLNWLDRDHLEVLLLDDVLEGFCIDDESQARSYYTDALLALLPILGKKKLKALFLCFPVSPFMDNNTVDTQHFERVVEMAKEYGIDLYGGEDSGAKKQHVLNFPMAPKEWDIRSGPDYGKRVERGFIHWDADEDIYVSADEAKDRLWCYVNPEEA